MADLLLSSEVESEIVGREGDKEKLVTLLTQVYLSENPMVLPVVGMGGLGKTTLAQLVYNDPRVKDHFKLLIWVCVSEEFHVGALTKLIIDTIVRKDCEVPRNNMELLQKRLREEIHGKRYLLVLDDVWNENVNTWEQLRGLLNCGDLGSVVLVTTRSNKVAAIMGTLPNYNLGEVSSKLFHRRAFGMRVGESEELVEIGKKSVKNSQGLPLAIKTLGSLTSYKNEDSSTTTPEGNKEEKLLYILIGLITLLATAAGIAAIPVPENSRKKTLVKICSGLFDILVLIFLGAMMILGIYIQISKAMGMKHISISYVVFFFILVVCSILKMVMVAVGDF